MEVLFVGVSSCIPDIGGDTACFLINGRHLVDTGWASTLRLRELGVDPLAVETLILTHAHHDHYLGLPQLLFYRAMHDQQATAPLRIIGPAGHTAWVADQAWQTLQPHRFPELRPAYEVLAVRAGETLTLGDLSLDTCAAKHVSGAGVAEEALSWRVTEEATGAALAFSGDTSYNPDLAELARGAAVLIHDASHTPAREAAEVGKAAGVGRLFLIHYPHRSKAALLSQARELFAETYLAEQGQRISL
jgi:ribonuclease Z